MNRKKPKEGGGHRFFVLHTSRDEKAQASSLYYCHSRFAYDRKMDLLSPILIGEPSQSKYSGLRM